MRIPAFISCILLITLFAMSCEQKDKTSNDRHKSGRTLNFEQPIAFLSANNDTLITIKTAVADDDKERSQGLMDVKNLPTDKGMLFIFEDNRPRSFWMANTPLSLDIIFVNNDFEIVRIHHSTQAFSEKSLSSEDPAKYVIETNGGFCISHDIQEGLKVSF